MTKSKVRRKQRECARKHLDELIDFQSGQCHWCNTLIARPKNLTNITEVRHYWVYWMSSDNGLCGAKIATVDHIKPLKDGGNNFKLQLIIRSTVLGQHFSSRTPDRTFLVGHFAVWGGNVGMKNSLLATTRGERDADQLRDYSSDSYFLE